MAFLADFMKAFAQPAQTVAQSNTFAPQNTNRGSQFGNIFAQGLQDFAKYDEKRRQQKYIKDLYAADPQFAQQFLGTQDALNRTELEEEEILRKRQVEERKRQALQQLATQLQNPGNNRQQALLQYGLLADDPKTALGAYGVGDNKTSDITNYELAKSDPAFADFLSRINARQASGTEAIVDQLRAEDPSLSYAQALSLAQGLARKGVTIGPDGNAVVMPGVAESLGELKYGETKGGKEADLEMDPLIASATEESKVIGKEVGEAGAKLSSMEAQFPRLNEVVKELSDLGKKATYTKAGQLGDTLMREAGQEVSPGAIARSEYISKVDNEILPLLRQTFGAQFTQKEGESLKTTLGDPNKSPKEKDAVLRSFISQKKAEIASLRRQTKSKGGPVFTPMNQGDIEKSLGGAGEVDFNSLPE